MTGVILKMLLHSLEVIINGVNIRSIEFKKGLNLIIDSTVRSDTESGNSVGKTTVLRVIDYCLGSDGKDIYRDPEFKDQKNQRVYEYLIKNEVVAKLKVITRHGKPLTLLRDITDQPKTFKVGDQSFSTIGAYTKHLNDVIFRQTRPKPSLRQLIPKFIRSNSYKMSHSLRYLHQSTPESTYETIHLALFGFEDIDILNSKQITASDFNKAEKRNKALKQGQSVVALRQSLKVIERDISAKEEQISNFEIGSTYLEESDRIQSVQQELSQLALELNEKKLRESFMKDALKELYNNKSKSDTKTIEKIYNEASKYIPELHVTFEDTLNFHEKMITRKADHLNSRLQKVEEECSKIQKKLHEKAKEESRILEFIASSGSLNDLKLMNEQLNRLYESKGTKKSALDQLKESEENVKRLQTELDNINKEIDCHLSELEKNLSSFNEEFSSLSKSLYEEEYILSYDIKKDKIQFTISNVDGNLGGGKKKGQVAAFDLAYLNFAKKIGVACPQFIMHDSVEDVHNNQLKTLVDYTSDFEGQYILSVLKDKVDNIGNFDATKHIVLELNESDKFFKLD